MTATDQQGGEAMTPQLDDIRISLVSREPLVGTATTGSRRPLHFEGWLQLLQVLAELVGNETLRAGRRESPRRSTGPRHP
jgi:hypothetical protein